jgi:hypothetical protein
MLVDLSSIVDNPVNPFNAADTLEWKEFVSMGRKILSKNVLERIKTLKTAQQSVISATGHFIYADEVTQSLLKIRDELSEELDVLEDIPVYDGG